MREDKEFDEIQEIIGVKFKNLDYLKQAFIHRSYLNEHRDFPLDHNERLEFLGDAVLELVVTEYLYKNFPNPEGEMTNWRAALVNTQMISKQSQRLGFNDYLCLSRGESKDTGKAREIILANTFESVIGAIYLDQGYNKSRDFISNNLLGELPEIIEQELYLDPKSKLQEASQEKFNITPTYRVLKEWGPDHARQFIIGAYLNTKKVGEGEGSSKHEAQLNAAKDGLDGDKWKKIYGSK